MEFPDVARRPSDSNPGKNWFRTDVRDLAYSIISSPLDFEVEASAGKGHAADVPWIGVRRKDITNSFRDGIYVVYLFATDRTHVYLSLLQGVTNLNGNGNFDERPSSKDLPILKSRARGLRNLMDIPEQFQLYEIDLQAKQPRSRAYEASHICGTVYDVSTLPTNERLVADLQAMLQFYRSIGRSAQSDAFKVDRGELLTAAAEQDGPPIASHAASKASNAVVDAEAWRVAIERRFVAHQDLLLAIRQKALDAGHRVRHTTHIDLVIDSKLLVEVKSVNGDAKYQVRDALSQLYIYRYTYRLRYENALLLAAFDKGFGEDSELATFLDGCNIAVAYRENGTFFGSDYARTIAPWLFKSKVK